MLSALTAQAAGAIKVFVSVFGGAVAQLGARLDGIEEVVGSNPIGSTTAPTSAKCCVLARIVGQ